MNLHFFGKAKPAIPFNVCLTIFGFLPEDSIDLSSVGPLWAAFDEDKKRPLPLFSTLCMIPYFPISPEDLVISQLSGGMTNGSYQLTSQRRKSESWVLRIAGKGTSTFINRTHEKANAQEASRLGLNVRVQWFDHKGSQLTPFLHASQPLSSPLINKKKYLKPIAQLFKTLHRHHDAFGNRVTITDRIATLWCVVAHKNPSLFPPETPEITRHLQTLMDLLSHFQVRHTACHNDPTLTNFLVVDDEKDPTLFLIDWEYSSKGDLLWDLVYFCLLAHLDEAATDAFLAAYFDLVTPTINAWFIAYQPLVTWWVCLWCYAQLANDSPSSDVDTYHRWAEDYLLRTTSLLQSPSYQQALSLILHEKEDHHEGLVARSF